MTQHTPELLPCPFCGGNKLRDFDRDKANTSWCSVAFGCDECEATTEYFDYLGYAHYLDVIKKAHQAWNTRAPDLLAENERLKAEIETAAKCISSQAMTLGNALQREAKLLAENERLKLDVAALDVVAKRLSEELSAHRSITVRNTQDANANFAENEILKQRNAKLLAALKSIISHAEHTYWTAEKNRILSADLQQARAAIVDEENKS